MIYELVALSPDERKMANVILQGIPTNQWVRETMREAEKKDVRCALIAYLPPDDKRQDWIVDLKQAYKAFPLEEVGDALLTHDPDHQICVLFVRDNKVTVKITERHHN